MALKSYQDLIVWQKAMDLVVCVYRATTGFPSNETFGLTNQLRRAAVSIPSNIAEGQARRSTRDFLNFLSIARGSLQELETQVLLALRLGYLEDSAGSQLIDSIAEISRLLSGLSNSLSSTRH